MLVRMAMHLSEWDSCDLLISVVGKGYKEAFVVSVIRMAPSKLDVGPKLAEVC